MISDRIGIRPCMCVCVCDEFSLFVRVRCLVGKMLAVCGVCGFLERASCIHKHYIGVNAHLAQQTRGESLKRAFIIRAAHTMLE